MNVQYFCLTMAYTESVRVGKLCLEKSVLVQASGHRVEQYNAL